MPLPISDSSSTIGCFSETTEIVKGGLFLLITELVNNKQEKYGIILQRGLSCLMTKYYKQKREQ